MDAGGAGICCTGLSLSNHNSHVKRAPAQPGDLMFKFGLFAAYVCVKVMRWVLAVAEKLPPPVAEV